MYIRHDHILPANIALVLDRVVYLFAIHRVILHCRKWRNKICHVLSNRMLKGQIIIFGLAVAGGVMWLNLLNKAFIFLQLQTFLFDSNCIAEIVCTRVCSDWIRVSDVSLILGIAQVTMLRPLLGSFSCNWCHGDPRCYVSASHRFHLDIELLAN